MQYHKYAVSAYNKADTEIESKLLLMYNTIIEIMKQYCLHNRTGIKKSSIIISNYIKFK